MERSTESDAIRGQSSESGAHGDTLQGAETAIYLGWSPRESLSAWAPTQAVGSGRRQPFCWKSTVTPSGTSSGGGDGGWLTATFAQMAPSPAARRHVVRHARDIGLVRISIPFPASKRAHPRESRGRKVTGLRVRASTARQRNCRGAAITLRVNCRLLSTMCA